MTAIMPVPPLAQGNLSSAGSYYVKSHGPVIVSRLVFGRPEVDSLADGYAALADDEEFRRSRRVARARSQARPPRSAADE